jgi:hypothetical protein
MERHRLKAELRTMARGFMVGSADLRIDFAVRPWRAGGGEARPE